MTMATFVTWLAVGLLTGGLAGIALKERGRGRASDIALALFGSSGASLVAALAWDVASDADPLVTGLLAFVGAAVMILAQRTLWRARA